MYRHGEMFSQSRGVSHAFVHARGQSQKTTMCLTPYIERYVDVQRHSGMTHGRMFAPSKSVERSTKEHTKSSSTVPFRTQIEQFHYSGTCECDIQLIQPAHPDRERDQWNDAQRDFPHRIASNASNGLFLGLFPLFLLFLSTFTTSPILFLLLPP